MLRGNHPAKVDEKGRLKIPAEFVGELERMCKGDFWVTSPHGEYAWVYPMPEWNKIEERLANGQVNAELRRQFLDWTNYYGQVVTWDKQARILIPALLREDADIQGEVAVLGNLTHLVVRNKGRYKASLEQRRITPEDLNALGI